MQLVVDVPFNTAIADLDEALRSLLRRELDRHGFENAEIAFDAPAKDWSSKLTSPTVDLFLYDLREATERADVSPTERRGNGQSMVTPPPLRLELTYSVSAWTKAVQDEHRLLSQVLAILYSHTRMPGDLLSGGLTSAEMSVGRPREEKADFWTSVGGSYKASIDVVVHITVESGATIVRGPEVRSQRMITRPIGGHPDAVVELHRFGGTVSDGDGAPVQGVWVVLPGAGRWAATDTDGRFVFSRVTPGKHEIVVRTPSGDETKTTATIPGDRVDVVVGGKRSKKS